MSTRAKPKIEIRLVGRAGELKAFADLSLRVKFGEITIRRFKVLSKEDGKPWVAFPQVQYSQFLDTRYANLLTMNKRVEEYLKNRILQAYRKQIAGGPNSKPESILDLAELPTLIQEGVR